MYKNPQKQSDVRFLVLFKIAFVILFFQTKFSTAQINYGLSEGKRNTILIAPFNVFDIENPSFQLGYERVFKNPKYALAFDAGIIMNHSLPDYLIDQLMRFENCPYYSNGYKLRTELKYFIKLKSFYKPYFSAEIFYMKNTTMVEDEFLISDAYFDYHFDVNYTFKVYYDFFKLQKEKIGLNLKAGWKFPMTRRLLCEVYCGVGVAYRNNVHFNRLNPADKPTYDGYFNGNSEGGRWQFGLPVNVKFGYSF